MVPFRLPDLFLLIVLGGCATYIRPVTCGGRQNTCELEAEHLEAKGLQKVEFMVARSKAEGLYDTFQGVRSQQEPSTSIGPLLPSSGTSMCQPQPGLEHNSLRL